MGGKLTILSSWIVDLDIDEEEVLAAAELLTKGMSDKSGYVFFPVFGSQEVVRLGIELYIEERAVEDAFRRRGSEGSERL